MTTQAKEFLFLLVVDADGDVRKVVDRYGVAVNLLSFDLHSPTDQRRVAAALREAVDHYYNS
jgi:hypothetical protein